MKKGIKQKATKTMPLSVLNFMVAGIDVGASAHYVCVGSLSEESVKRFGTFTQDLEALADWLVSLGVESVAMESTGIYWVNLYDTLESRGLKVCLANARYVRNVPGRKSDVAYSQWIQQLHSYGLLSGSFIAEGKIRELRAYVRQRKNLEKQKGIQVALMGKALQLLNIKLHQIASGTEIRWVCLPNQRLQAKKIVGHFKHSVANKANQAFRIAAWALNNSKCYLGSFYRKLSARKGSFVAIKATARKVAVIFGNMMTKKTEFEPHSQEEYETKYKDRQLKNLEKMAKKLGMSVQKV
jgi:hypothetical protein